MQQTLSSIRTEWDYMVSDFSLRRFIENGGDGKSPEVFAVAEYSRGIQIKIGRIRQQRSRPPGRTPQRWAEVRFQRK